VRSTVPVGGGRSPLSFEMNHSPRVLTEVNEGNEGLSGSSFSSLPSVTRVQGFADWAAWDGGPEFRTQPLQTTATSDGTCTWFLAAEHHIRCWHFGVVGGCV
jgi:hypothetical protein